jgi:deoxyribose-phosphate aldolase
MVRKFRATEDLRHVTEFARSDIIRTVDLRPPNHFECMLMNYTYEDISRMIDHSLLKPTLTFEDFESGCRMAVVFKAGSVCIQPHYLKRCAQILKGSGVKASTVVGFPHGGHTTAVKVEEAKRALADGGEELDMVCNISRVLSGDWDYVRQDIKAVIDVTHAAGQKVKVIFENCYLEDDQKIQLCEICSEFNADWVKTSTGYGTGGATMDDLRLMRKHSAANVQVKAAGGVRDMDALLQCREIGVTRIGASATQAMLDECRLRLNLEPIRFDGDIAADGY